MPMAADQIESLIREGIPDAFVEIVDLAGDGDHYEARVVPKASGGAARQAASERIEALGEEGTSCTPLKLTTAIPNEPEEEYNDRRRERSTPSSTRGRRLFMK